MRCKACFCDTIFTLEQAVKITRGMTMPKVHDGDREKVLNAVNEREKKGGVIAC